MPISDLISYGPCAGSEGHVVRRRFYSAIALTPAGPVVRRICLGLNSPIDANFLITPALKRVRRSEGFETYRDQNSQPLAPSEVAVLQVSWLGGRDSNSEQGLFLTW